TGCADGGYDNHQNGTYQTVGDTDLRFTVETHIGIPAGVTEEHVLAAVVKSVLERVVELDLGIAFSVYIGTDSDEPSACTHPLFSFGRCVACGEQVHAR